MNAAQSLPVWGVFADGDIRLEFDKDGSTITQPSLSEMTKKTLDLLEKVCRLHLTKVLVQRNIFIKLYRVFFSYF